ncbi:uncharacterized protein CELE_Y53C10A.10 [Caenorhabditis elegans]|uniref:Secreted protein n=1 Tax=Caenorhabditis elegans TaxID=6239 RepID=Q9XW47_CAEEL|nr:Secreted protein [Caenorhabditis elegans]CAA22144.4 Secreted protein [Caenorhabditis elegans]
MYSTHILSTLVGVLVLSTATTATSNVSIATTNSNSSVPINSSVFQSNQPIVIIIPTGANSTGIANNSIVITIPRNFGSQGRPCNVSSDDYLKPSSTPSPGDGSRVHSSDELEAYTRSDNEDLPSTSSSGDGSQVQNSDDLEAYTRSDDKSSTASSGPKPIKANHTNLSAQKSFKSKAIPSRRRQFFSAPINSSARRNKSRHPAPNKKNFTALDLGFMSGSKLKPLRKKLGAKGKNNGVRELAAHNRSLEILPDGTPLRSLGEKYIVKNGPNQFGNWSKVVANKHGFYVLHPVQTKNVTDIFDPYTIGQVLGYLYELAEFGGDVPPSGKFTIDLMSLPTPQKLSSKRRRAILVFKRKKQV